MNGPQHYSAAEDCLKIAEAVWLEAEDHSDAHVAHFLAQAQVHATLALTAATIDSGRAVTTMRPGQYDESITDSAPTHEADWAEVTA